jgi:hypothetical protein
MSGSKNRHSGLIRGDDEDEALKAYVPARWRQSPHLWTRSPEFAGRPFEMRTKIFCSGAHLKLGHILLIAAIAGIALAHGTVLYKIDVGAHSIEKAAATASRSHRGFW